ncbi:MAG: Cu(I)-responsive transcriptional regulator [Hydrocarboniphaga sp.]|uniref:Cu(I)-responsive transcriptional regulator n=1 Tax=Hydrocarboniphaga sp. TaxID=2033016 RepID=UPI0026269205|nr:Cu(I)-responsive transcriptional regulator [Hydrocarboniphaga sp.]MDB5969389.1 Cu(I)-responsive transcriptional regulator [Hydrocarboniphaga sp.]
MPRTEARKAAAVVSLNIGQAAEASGVSAKMIRHYESIGLLHGVDRSDGNYRRYDESQLHSLRFIKRARGLGFSTGEIEELLGLWRNPRRASAEVKRMAQRHVADLDAKIDELRSMRNALSDLARHCHGDQRADCPILEDLAATVQRT